MNEKLTDDDIKFIRSLDAFDLTMLISEISDFNWDAGKMLIPLIKQAQMTRAVGDE